MGEGHRALARVTDDDGFLTDGGLRWLAMLVFVAAIAVVSYMGQHDAHAERPPVVTTTTSTALAPSTSTTSNPPVSSTSSTTTTTTSTTLARAQSRAARVTWAVSSTVYCLGGNTASGAPVADGLVAVSYANWPRLRGTRWRVVKGPPEILGRTFLVADKGPAADFDVWMGNRPNCRTWGHDVYGRKPATVVPA